MAVAMSVASDEDVRDAAAPPEPTAPAAPALPVSDLYTTPTTLLSETQPQIAGGEDVLSDVTTPAEPDADHTKSRFERWMSAAFDAFFTGFYKLRIVVVVVWILLALAGAYPALLFLSSTTLYINPPSASLAYDANQLIAAKFPGTIKEGQVVVALWADDGASILRAAQKAKNR